MLRVAVAFALALACSVFALDVRASDDVPFGLRDTTLSNGLRVITDQAARVPLVSVVLAFSVGSTQDPPNRSGLAELTLDLMAHRSQHVKEGELVAQLDQLATTWRFHSTSNDSYIAATVPSHALERILWLFSDAMGFAAEALDQRRVDATVALYANKRSQLDDASAGLAFQLKRQTEFPEGHPYHHVWDNADLTGLTVAEVADFQKRYFVPRNAVLAISGWAVRDEVDRLVTKYFGSLPGGATMPRLSVPTSRLGGETRLEVGAPTQTTRVSIAWPTPAIYANGDAELDAVAGILDGIRTARLMWELDSKKHLVSAISAHQQSWRYGSEFEIAAAVRQGHTPDEVIDAVDGVLRDLQTSPPTTDDLNGALLPMLTRRMFGYESSLTRALRVTDWIFEVGTSNYLQKDIERYQVTPAQVLAVAARVLPLDRRVISIVTPDPSAPLHGVLRRRTFKAAP
jgi:predicted Zn-dependent peptidase